MNFIVTFFLGWLLYLIPAFTSAQTTAASSMSYKDCTALVYTNSANALAYADSWISGGQAPAVAKHCRALALYGMKHFPAAAKELDDFAATSTSLSATSRIDALKQAAQAWQDAGDYQSAINSLGRAIATAADSDLNPPQSYEMLMQQANLLIKINQYPEAIHALDNAYEVNPNGSEAVILRSRIYQAMGVNIADVSRLSPKAGKPEARKKQSASKQKDTEKPRKQKQQKVAVKTKSHTKARR